MSTPRTTITGTPRTETTFTNPHTAEVAHDTELLRLLGESYRASNAVMNASDRIASFVRDYRLDAVTVNRRGRNPKTTRNDNGQTILGAWNSIDLLEDLADADKLAAVVAHYDAMPSYSGFYRDPASIAEKAAERVAAFKAAQDAAKAAREAVVEHEKSYDDWSRFFLVTSSAGHVHRSMYCSSCYDTTSYAPVPSLSGSSDVEAVALFGPNLCTVCFPLAPVDHVGGKMTQTLTTILIEDGEDAFRKALRAQAAKAAEKCDAAPHDHDGSHGHLYRPWGTCNKCGRGVSLTSTGKMRSHRPKGQ